MELDERISLLMQENNWKVRDVAVISGVTEIPPGSCRLEAAEEWRLLLLYG